MGTVPPRRAVDARMIKIAISAEAFEAIARTLPPGIAVDIVELFRQFVILPTVLPTRLGAVKRRATIAA
jgi:hypothetical protein